MVGRSPATRHERTSGLEVLSAAGAQVVLRAALAEELHRCRYEAPEHGESRKCPEHTYEASVRSKGVGAGDQEAACRPVQICPSRLHGLIVGYGIHALAVFADSSRQAGFLAAA